MDKEVKVLELDKYEYGLVINALNEFRNKTIKDKMSTDSIDELLLKLLETPQKKKVFLKKYEEAR